MRKNWIQASVYYCGRLANAYHVNFLGRVAERMATFINNLSEEDRAKVPQLLTEAWQEFRAAQSAEDYAFKTSSKSELTALIEKADTAYQALKGIVEAYARMGGERARSCWTYWRCTP